MKLRSAFAVAVCAALLLMAASSFADDIKVDYNHHANFATYRTYSWSSVKVTNQLNADRIKRAMDSLLQQKGWQMVPSGGQVTIMATDNIHTEQEAETYYDGMGGGWGGGWGWGGWGWGGGDGGFGDATTTTNDVRMSHLVIDMFDAKSKSLLWRGVSRGELTDNPNKNRNRLHEDIQHMFKDFPPKGK